MKCEFFTELTDYIYKLKFKEKPRYGYMRHLLAKNLMELNMVPNN